MSSVLECQNLCVGYQLGKRGDRRLLEDLSLTLEPGELVCVLGANGAGKSTLLRTLVGMQSPLAGKVLLEGEELRRLPAASIARRVSVVLTEPVEAGALIARDLVALGRYPYTDWLGRLTQEDHARVDWALESVGAGALAQRRVANLSDGERQRVLIARALAQEPLLMVLDEPTAFLDLPSRIETLGLLWELARGSGVAVLLATHHLDLALDHADRVWLLSRGGGVVSAAPEDAVLCGDLERTFGAAGLRFDQEEGSFRLEERAEVGPRVGVEGNGVARIWTERALARERLSVGPPADGDFARLRIVSAGGQRTWELETESERVTCGSIYEVLERLRVGLGK